MKKFMKRVTALTLTLAMAFSTVAFAYTASPEEQGLIPVRDFFEEIGGYVAWDESDRSISVSIDGTYMVITLDDGVTLWNDRAFISEDDLMALLLQGVTVQDGEFAEAIHAAVTTAEFLMDAMSISGMTVAIVDAETGFTWIQGFGYADVANGIPVDENSVFQLASISKFFTSVAVMQLVEEGVIDLDTPLVEYLPQFSIPPSPTGGDYRNITLRMLLTHTSGILSDFHGYGSLTTGEHNPNSMNNLLENLARYFMVVPENTVFSYANNNFELLGVLVAYLTGEDNFFDDFVSHTAQSIFEPAGMTRSSFAVTDNVIPYLAMAHADAETPDEFIFANFLATGGVMSSAYDMTRFMHIILGGGDLLSAESVQQILTVHDFDFSLSIGGMQYGLGAMFTTSADGFVMSGHNGNLIHYHSAMVFDVDSSIGVFVAVNSISGMHAVPALSGGVLATAVMEKTGELPTLPHRADPDATPIELSAEELAQFEGLFVSQLEYYLLQLDEYGALNFIVPAMSDLIPALPLTPMSDGSFHHEMLGVVWLDHEVLQGEELVAMRLGTLGTATIAIMADPELFLATDDFIHMMAGNFVPVPVDNHVNNGVLYRYGVDEFGFAYIFMTFRHGLQAQVPIAVNAPVEEGIGLEEWFALQGMTDVEFDEDGRVISYYSLGLRFERE